MQLMNEIPDTFWSLFRSVNRDIYIEALLCINEEYEYNNYFLTKEVCIQILSDMNAKKRFELQREENGTDFDMLETPSSRILNWLLRAGWLKRIEDYNTLVTNIVIPDYAAVMIDAFEKLNSEDASETDIYIQNVYATLYAFRNDPRASVGLLRTALVNTRRLNKALQDMLHNMNKFFAKLLQQDSYSGILREHLDSYVEEIVWKKYHILKTSDNFYIYKMDIKKCLREIRDDEAFIMKVQARSKMLGDNQDDVLDLLDLIERGFDNIEHRIANMDKEHTKYVRATVTRMNYLLSGETDTKGLVVQLLNKMSEEPEQMEEIITETGKRMNLSLLEILSEKSLYKKRKRRDFASQVEEEKQQEELSREDVLRLNKIHTRFSQEEIEDFVESYMEDDHMEVKDIDITDEEAFEKLILAYDYSTRRNSKYKVIEREDELIDNGSYRYPALTFVRREPKS
mgnify:CR=1 FL=1